MTGHLAPVEAYRRDLNRVPGRARITDGDAGWLVLAQAVWAAAGHGRAAAPATALAGDALHTALSAAATVGARGVSTSDDRNGGAGGPRDLDALTGAVTGTIERMEEAGALLLAGTTLAALRTLLGDGAPLLAGRVLAQWARVQRQLGDFGAAADLYTDAAQLGRRARLPELLARADIGHGILARVRGDYPAARVHFRRALTHAERAGRADVIGLAHQGLFIAAAVARDFDTALTHGWAAFALAAGQPGQEADVLVNLGTLCLDAGQDQAALQSFLTAGARAAGARTRLAATAGAAVAAARLGQDALLQRYTAALEAALTQEGTPYERAQHLLTLSDAWTAAGVPTTAAAYRERGRALAREHQFAELEHQYGPPAGDAPAMPARTGPAALATGARRVIHALAALPGDVPGTLAGAAGAV